jgi:FixJ family two-component response regulator
MLRVAIVDDDASHCRALARLLRVSGMETLTFGSAEEYLAGQSESRIDCLVLDIRLGGMSGFELQSRLSNAGSPPPIVFLTAQEDETTTSRAALTGCACIRKTEAGHLLLSAIREAARSRSTFPKGKS